MSTFKKTKVVMLPTNEKAKKGDLMLQGNTLIKASYDSDWANAEHLYFLLDEEIKEGDWYINTWGDGQPMLCKVNSKEEANDCNRLNYCCKKIIATTDKSLVNSNCCIAKEGLTKMNEGCRDRNRCLIPQPSQSFIEKFVEEYNKGNVISEVSVEYYYSTFGSNKEELTNNEKLVPKINPKDNTITIRKVKDSWSREEVKVILEKAIYEREQFLNKSGTLSYNFDKWIEENL